MAELSSTCDASETLWWNGNAILTLRCHLEPHACLSHWDFDHDIHWHTGYEQALADRQAADNERAWQENLAQIEASYEEDSCGE